MDWKRRVIAALLALCMIGATLPVFAAADEVQTDGALTPAEELPGVSRLEDSLRQAEPETAAPYADDEMVTVIVLMDAPAVIEHYDAGSAEGDSAGAAVSAFLTSADARELSRELLREQSAVLSRIGGTGDASQSQVMAAGTRSDQPEVLAQWTSVVNGMAIRIPYGQLESLKAMDGVYNAYVQQTFDRPEEPTTEAGPAGYSYDMVGIAGTWEAGFTGAGMLVAILDTGLDLEYSTYWSDADNANITGVRRVHEAFTGDSFMTEAGKENVRWTSSGLEWFLENNQLNATTGAEGNQITYDNNALYKNRKVPYAADYADGDVNVRPVDSDHGTHVAGTVAGYAVTEEGEVTFSGVAPDAQILAMKVFPDDTSSGAPEYAIINALEDAAALGADVMNLSLGSDNGFAQDDTAAGQVYRRLRDAGILFMVSAGNAGYSSSGSHYGDYGLAADPDISMVSSPSVYADNLSVASINNTVSSASYLQWTDTDGTVHEVAFDDPTGAAMKYKFAGEESLSVNIIPVDGVGSYEDYYNAGFRSYYGYGEKGVAGIALVQRGEISFVDKINNATRFSWSYYDTARGYYVTEYPIQAVLIYDNVAGSTELITMDASSALLTSAFISNVDGTALAAAAKAAMEAGTYVTLTKVEREDRITQWDSGSQMSEFTSWGAGPGLELKPEITAPGGNIWSAVLDTAYTEGSGSYDDYTGTYAMMSGTSMASPHMTGITALVKEYAKRELGLSGTEAANVTECLMMSTAVPQTDGNGVYYSPRQQGAGLVNAAAAVKTPAYITVDGGIGKLELKDDPEKTGEYRLTFTVHNLSGTELTYNAAVSLLRPEVIEGDSDWGTRSYMTDSDVLLRTVNLGAVRVPAHDQVTVSRTVSLTADEKKELDDLFEDGTYVEGFVELTDAAGVNPRIGLPMLAFYGDWTSAPILDRSSWLDGVEEGGSYFTDNESTWGSTVFGYFDGYTFYNLGQNPFDSTAATAQTEYHQENITISPTGLFQVVNDPEIYQLRNAKVMVVEVRDKETGALYFRDYGTYQFKCYNDPSYGMAIPSSLYYFTGRNWDGTDLDGEVLPSGTQCVYTLTAYGDGDYPMVYDAEAGYMVTDVEAIIPGENEPTFNGHAMDMTGDVFSFDVLVDTEAPKLVNSAVSVYEEDGRIYMEGTFEDDGSMASVEILPLVTRSYKQGYGDPTYAESGLDRNNPFYSEMIYDAACHQWHFKADVTEYAHTTEAYPGESYYYDFTWSGAVYVFGGDYGGNDRAYGVQVNATSGLVLSTTSARLHVGGSFDLSVNNNTGSDAAITRSSSNPQVATVDEFGHVTALAPGQTIITVSNGTDFAACVVIVEEYPTEVLDFDLSIDHFSGLKPDGSIVVNVVNLKPADVVITENTWLVYEDDADWAGLLTVEKDAQSGMSGRISLSASLDDGEEPSAGSGYLEVTLNGVTRTMTLDWEELYVSSAQDDLTSDSFYNEQTVYVTQGETATLIAKYRQNHSFIPVELYTLEGYQAYSYSNPTTAATGVTLDGPNFAANGTTWTGKLVAQPGYTLPSEIKVLTRYSYGYESEMYLNSYYGGYTYDPETGVIVVKEAPYGADNTLVIRADGVPTEGAPGGTTSGETYQRPDGTYGPFDWAASEGQTLTGDLTTAEGVLDYYTTKNVAYYTPSEPGVSHITATSRDGKYSMNFAVVCLPIQAETVTLDVNRLEMEIGETMTLTATLDPEPTLEADRELIWTSFNERVATVDENGVVTAVSGGYAYIKVATAADTTVMTCCVVHVNGPATPFTDVAEDAWYYDGVEYVYQHGLMNGTSETTFSPYENVTRGMMVTVLYRTAGAPEVTETGSFTDVDANRFFADAVAWAQQVGIANGYPDGTFRPDDSVTRADMVTFLYRYAAMVEGKDVSTTGSLDGFADADSVPNHAAKAMIWAVENGAIHGTGPDTLAPNETAQRCQLAVILLRYLTGE